ncbi:MAG TPA: DUF2167 domain-containing protein [Tahibacter sp.]|nr:DUF2167 domain-containing protein [Tahibacter sp.]
MELFRNFMLAAALACAGAAHAQDADGNAEAVKAFLGSLHFQSGTVTVPQAHATLKLAPEYRYLGAADAQKVLEQLWGNPPDADVLGMLLPGGEKTLVDQKAWAVVLTHADEGHVSDADAAGTDYDKMLKDMQAAAREENPEREKQGYPAVDIVGWAAKPHYDNTTNKIYWAKELKFSGSDGNTLNYDIRVLGRSGYLSMNAVAPMSELATVETGMQRVIAMTEFDTGHRYADFNASTDKVAAYGVAALVGGALASKAGLFAKLLALLVAGKKFVGIAVIGLVALVGRLFGRKK